MYIIGHRHYTRQLNAREQHMARSRKENGSNKDGRQKKAKHKDPKKIFNEAKVAFEALALIAQTSKGKSADSSEANSNTSNASPSDISSIDSNKSQSSSEGYQTADYDTDES